MTLDFFRLRPLTLNGLAKLYKVSRPTMRQWIRDRVANLGQRIGYFFSLHQVVLIIKSLGDPRKIKKGRPGKKIVS